MNTPTQATHTAVPKYAVVREQTIGGRSVESVVRIGKHHGDNLYTVFYSDNDGRFERNGYTRALFVDDQYVTANEAFKARIAIARATGGAPTGATP